MTVETFIGILIVAGILIGCATQRNWQGEKVAFVSNGGHLLFVADLCPCSPGLAPTFLYLQTQVTE